ncbi:MAG: SH3 domain-containing protein, partial [Chloroflexota bacterium]
PPPTDIPPTATPTTPQATILTGANVRSGPSTLFEVVGAFAAGATTDALAVNPDRSWYKIQYFNAEGWIFSDLVSVSNEDQLPVEEGPPSPTLTPIPPTPVPATEAPPPAQINLVFDGPVSINPYPPDCGETMEISVSIRNEGSESMGRSAALRVVDTHVDSGTRTETTAPIPDIGPGETRTVEGIFLTVETNFDATHRIQVILDANNEIGETNEGDNSSRAEALEYTLDASDNC